MQPCLQNDLSNNLEDFKDMYRANLVEANPLNGNYAGSIVNWTENYAAQLVAEDGVEIVVLHDRAVLDAASA